MDDIVQLIIFLAIVFFSLMVGGSKKKRQQQQRRAQRSRHPAQSVGEGTGAQAPERMAERKPFAQEILDLLQAQLPEPPAEEHAPPERPLREAVALDAFVREAKSLETLEAAGGKSHEVFHERYMDGPVSESKKSRPSQFRRINPRTAREAVIWSTIFSPPKGLE